MKLNNRFIFGILSLVLAAVIAFVALPTIARQTNGKTEIVRITQPVLKGEQVTKENAEVVEVGGYNLPTNVAHSLEDVEGLYVTADLAAGDYILTSKVSSVPISSDVALNDIPSGKVAISLTVKTLASGLSDKLQPNDIVRIYHFLETAEEVPELRFVKVLSVTDSDGINVDNTKEPTEDEEPQQSARPGFFGYILLRGFYTDDAELICRIIVNCPIISSSMDQIIFLLSHAVLVSIFTLNLRDSETVTYCS